jgi:hypothetical protein
VNSSSNNRTFQGSADRARAGLKVRLGVKVAAGAVDLEVAVLEEEEVSEELAWVAAGSADPPQCSAVGGSGRR